MVFGLFVLGLWFRFSCGLFVVYLLFDCFYGLVLFVRCCFVLLVVGLFLWMGGLSCFVSFCLAVVVA